MKKKDRQNRKSFYYESYELFKKNKNHSVNTNTNNNDDNNKNDSTIKLKNITDLHP
jgi:hypothetical protein